MVSISTGGAMNSAVSQGGLVAAAKLLNRTVRFVVAVYLARTLGPEAYGQFAYAFRFVLPFVALGDLGLELFGISQLAKVSTGWDALVRRIALLKLMLGVGAGALVALAAWLTPEASGVRVLIVAFVPLVLVNEGTFNWPFLAARRAEFVAGATMVSSLVLGVGILAVVRGAPDVLAAAVIMVIASAVEPLVLIAVYVTRRRRILGRSATISSPLSWASGPGAGGILRQAWPLGAGAVLIRLYVSFPALLLGWRGSMTLVGLYQVAMLVPQLMLTLAQAGLNAGLLPAVAGAEARGEARARVADRLESIVLLGLVAGAVASVIGVLFGPAIVGRVFGSEYTQVGVVFGVALFLGTVDVLTQAYRTVMVGSARYLAFFVSLVLQVGLVSAIAWLLIPRLGVWGVVVPLIVIGVGALLISSAWVRAALITTSTDGEE